MEKKHNAIISFFIILLSALGILALKNNITGYSVLYIKTNANIIAVLILAFTLIIISILVLFTFKTQKFK